MVPAVEVSVAEVSAELVPLASVSDIGANSATAAAAAVDGMSLSSFISVVAALWLN